MQFRQQGAHGSGSCFCAWPENLHRLGKNSTDISAISAAFCIAVLCWCEQLCSAAVTSSADADCSLSPVLGFMQFQTLSFHPDKMSQTTKLQQEASSLFVPGLQFIFSCNTIKYTLSSQSACVEMCCAVYKVVVYVYFGLLFASVLCQACSFSCSSMLCNFCLNVLPSDVYYSAVHFCFSSLSSLLSTAASPLLHTI